MLNLHTQILMSVQVIRQLISRLVQILQEYCCCASVVNFLRQKTSQLDLKSGVVLGTQKKWNRRKIGCEGSFDLPAGSAVTVRGICENVTVWEWSAHVICVFSSCPQEHLALIYHSFLSNITAGGFKGRSSKRSISERDTFLYVVQLCLASFHALLLPYLFFRSLYKATVLPLSCISFFVGCFLFYFSCPFPHIL